MTNYSIETCLSMIAHYSAQSVNAEKPAAWRGHARMSLADWQVKLERARAA